MYLMNGNRKVLWFDDDYTTIKVLDNEYLPYAMKDYIKDSDIVSFQQAVFNIGILKDFFINRILLLSQENAKAILNSAHLPQSLKTSEKLKIVEFCRAVTMGDNFWIQKDDENLTFDDVNLRKTSLSEIVFDIAVLGKTLSVQRELLTPALTTKGMHPKTFMRDKEGIWLIKTDTLNDNALTKAELQVSKMLDASNVKHIQYFESHKQVVDIEGKQKDLLMAKCKCYANDKYSVVEASSVREWCAHTKKDFLLYVKQNFSKDFAKMCVIDYLFANTDRHWDNWGFMVDNETNEIIGLAPLFDHNNALIADIIGTDIDTLMYDPTDTTMKEAAITYFPMAYLQIDKTVLPYKSLQRLEMLERTRGRKPQL